MPTYLLEPMWPGQLGGGYRMPNQPRHPVKNGPSSPPVLGPFLVSPQAALFVDLSKFDHAAITERGHIRMMAPESKTLTRDEFASLLSVGKTCAVLEPPAVIPAEHSARLIGLGYMVDLSGRLRLTTPGRQRIAAAENQTTPLRESNQATQG
jgi:hypothetical protein